MNVVTWFYLALIDMINLFDFMFSETQRVWTVEEVRIQLYPIVILTRNQELYCNGELHLVPHLVDQIQFISSLQLFKMV